LEKFGICCWRREKISWTDLVKNEEVLNTEEKERKILHTTKKEG
jgi:hypothetical protein